MNDYLVFFSVVMVVVAALCGVVYWRFRMGLVTKIVYAMLAVAVYAAGVSFILGKEGLYPLVFIVMAVFGIGIVTSVVWMIRRTLLVPMVSLNTVIERLANDRDLSLLPERTRRTDELGRMQNSLLGLMEMLQEFTVSVSAMVGQVNDAAKAVYATSQNLSASTAQQGAAVQEVVSATREMDQSSQMVVAKAKGVAEVGQQLSESSQATMNRLERLGASVQHFSNMVGDLGKRMSLLEQNVENIQGINDSVREFADQSSALAVNANIEASTAGQYGLGFSVVADEVSIMAKHSAQAADEIRKILDSIDKSVQELSAGVEDNLKHLHHNQNSLSELTEFMETFSEAVLQTAGQAFEAMEMVAEQRVGYSQINTAMEQISLGSNDGTQQVAALDSSMAALTRTNESLRAALGQFQL